MYDCTYSPSRGRIKERCLVSLDFLSLDFFVSAPAVYEWSTSKANPCCTMSDGTCIRMHSSIRMKEKLGCLLIRSIEKRDYSYCGVRRCSTLKSEWNMYDTLSESQIPGSNLRMYCEHAFGRWQHNVSLAILINYTTLLVFGKMQNMCFWC